MSFRNILCTLLIMCPSAAWALCKNYSLYKQKVDALSQKAEHIRASITQLSQSLSYSDIDPFTRREIYQSRTLHEQELAETLQHSSQAEEELRRCVSEKD